SLEEAGVTVKILEYLFKYVPSPGGLVEYLRMYAGECDASAVDVNRTHGLDEENDEIRLHLLDADVAIALLDSDVENA
ncbi:NUDIX hydrolase, partial [Marinomonas arenicola]